MSKEVFNTARSLYDMAGFVLTKEKPNNEWSDVEIIEQKMEPTLI